MSTTVNTFFWFDNQAEQAAAFYTSVVPESRIVDTTRTPDGAVFTVQLELAGHALTLLNGGPGHEFTDAASIQVVVDTQAEIDRLWAALTEGGEPGPCGWLTDKYGVSWQVAPADLPKLMAATDPARLAALTTALRGMSKIDVQALRDAYDRA
ncbi:VOC family protein [Nocardia sp. NPDC127526]|uniref:VOC family protein n=1 Tax=Nocardia sp. NPDC127526 TaxID=3345393 RepID=UPI003626B81A